MGKCLIIAVVISTFVVVALQDKLNLTVYYETLCPYSRRFLMKRLIPTYDKLKDYIELDLVPYGKADQHKENDTWEFSCQHGPEECHGNKIHACILNQTLDIKTQLNFINCFLPMGQTTKSAKLCAYDFGIPWPELLSCIESEEGSDLLAQYGNRTHSLEPPLAGVPATYINGVFNPSLTHDIYYKLFKVVCSELNMPSPCRRE